MSLFRGRRPTRRPTPSEHPLRPAQPASSFLFARKLRRVRELYLGLALVGGDEAREGDLLARESGEVAKLFGVAREDDGRERAVFVRFAKVEKDRAALGGVGVHQSTSHRSLLADVVRG